MFIIEFFQSILNSAGDALSPFCLTCFCNDYSGFGDLLNAIGGGILNQWVWGNCPASALNPITAAYATQGYWAQADIIDYLAYTDFGVWAPLIYILAAVGGLISVALGQPPRNYIWFFLGPVFYNYLLGTRTAVTGVEWQVGGIPQDQREVWKLAEVGLRNSHITSRLKNAKIAINIDSKRTPRIAPATVTNLFSGATGTPPFDPQVGGTNIAAVSTVFLWFDEVLSSQIQWLVAWTGILDQGDSSLINDIVYSNLMKVSGGNGILTSLLNKIFGGNRIIRWHLLSNTKWPLLEDITSAKLSSPDLRDAFVTMMASECGDAIADTINESAFITASNGTSDQLPKSIFRDVKSAPTPPAGLYNSYTLLKRNLRNIMIPKPKSLKKLFESDEPGSFRHAVTGSGAPAGNEKYLDNIIRLPRIRCDVYLDLMIMAFRWEAGHIAYQILHSGPQLAEDRDLNAKLIVFSLFYGWDIKPGRDPWSGNGGDGLTDEAAQLFLNDLVLVYLFRNELALAPQPVDQRYTGSQQAKNYVEAYQRTVGSKNKFGELYVWALMMPYIQGLLLYYLAIAYPFACLLMIVPGMHKTLLTWASFWTWAKLWDVGFAMVQQVEKSVWAMIGNSTKAARVNDFIAEMQNWGSVGAESVANSPVPDIKIYDTAKPNIIELAYNQFDHNLAIFDRAMALGTNLDLDLANAYYIYIMAALYFAVPAVTGQIVLGAKAGAASLVGNAVGQVSQQAGNAAGQGYTGDITQRAKSNQHSIGQAAYAKQLRKNGLMHQALDAGNKEVMAGVSAQAIGAEQNGLKLWENNRAAALQTNSAIQGSLFAGIEGFMAGSQAVLQNARASKGGNQAGPLNQEVPGVVPSGRDNPGNENPTDFATHGSETISGDGSGAIDTTESTARRGGGSSGENGARNRRTGATGKKMADSRGANLINLARNTLGPLTDFGPNGAGVYVIRGMSTAGGAALRASAGAEIAAVNAQAAELNIAGFEQSAAARGYGLHAGRMSQYADFDAQEASWQAQNRFAGQMAGMTAAMGVLAGSLDPGAKPKSAMGMAMAGMLDSDAQQSAKKRGWFAGEGGAFWGMSDSLKTTLDNNVGGQAIGDAYEVYSARQLLEAGAIGNINQAGQVFGVSDGNNTVNTTGTKALEHIKSSRENPGITGSRNSRVPDSLVNSSTAAAAKFNDNNFKKSFDI